MPSDSTRLSSQVCAFFGVNPGAPTLRTSFKHNWRKFKAHPMREVAGSLGDLGTLLPIMIALHSSGAISLPATLVFTGLYSIITGVVFGLPLPVQPMKALASASLSRGLSLRETMGAGLGVGVIIFTLSITGLLHILSRLIPIPVIKGIQMGTGFLLILNAGQHIRHLPWVQVWHDNFVWVIVAFITLLATAGMRRFPLALLLFILGIAFAVVVLLTTRGRLPSISIYSPHIYILTPNAISHGFLVAGLAQVPLTILNSVLATVALCADLFPGRPTPTVTRLGLSIGVMNILGTFFGCMPVCHGSGGLAAQYRFGARSGASIIFLGALKLLMGLFFGSSLEGLLAAFPRSFLGVMVFGAGLELLNVGRDLNTSAPDLRDRVGEGGLSEKERNERWLTMMVTVAATLALRSVLTGFCAGMVAWVLYRALDRWENREGSIRL